MLANESDQSGWEAQRSTTMSSGNTGASARRFAGTHYGATGREGARIAATALAVLANSRTWAAAELPQFGALPVEAMAISGAAISPWRVPAEIVPAVRMCLWICAFDDYVDAAGFGDGSGLDDLMRRCSNVVRGGRDETRPLLAALSDWQRDLECWPLYPALAALWIEKFDSMLDAMRWERNADRSEWHDGADLREYLAHADSIATWVTTLPRWITYGDAAVVEHLDTLVAALGEYVVADRLANDLGAFVRELDDLGSSNVLWYGVQVEWVKAEIGRRVQTVHLLLDPLAADGVEPAVELVRETDFATTFCGTPEFGGC